MHNILVLGCARSGTSAVAGVLGQSHYWMGHSLWQADSYNPKGYFEDSFLTAINEEILAAYMESPLARATNDPAIINAPSRGYWFGHLPLHITPVVRDQELASKMEAYLPQQRYCLKDPQFCYTLDQWRPFLSDERYICAFRSPRTTAASVVHMCGTRTYYKPCSIDMDYAFMLWELMYQHVLTKHTSHGDWMFIHYDQLFDDKSLDNLEMFVGHRLCRTFADIQMKKPALSDADCPEHLRALYSELCDRARYTT